MGQYQIGTVTLTPGSEKVSGESCAWVAANVQAGHNFKLQDEDAIYRIALVNSELTLSLTSNYSGGVSVSGESYQIVRDFTPNYDLPEIWSGDKDWPFHLTESLRLIDEEMATGGTGKKTVTDQGNVVTLDLTVSDLNKVHLLQNTGEAIITLPSVGADNVGSWLDFRKRGSGEVTINRADADLIHGQEWCKNETEQTFAMVVLLLEEETKWGHGPVVGDWEFST